MDFIIVSDEGSFYLVIQLFLNHNTNKYVVSYFLPASIVHKIFIHKESPVVITQFYYTTIKKRQKLVDMAISVYDLNNKFDLRCEFILLLRHE